MYAPHLKNKICCVIIFTYRLFLRYKCGERREYMGAVRFFSALSESLPVGGSAFIDTQALKSNYRTIMAEINRHSPRTESICVVKADAYGHTTEICAPVLAAAGCRRFAVANIAEACALRKTLLEAKVNGFCVIILGRTDIEYARLLSEYGFVQCVYSYEYAKALSESLESDVSVHIKIDTGMNRLGFSIGTPEKFEDSVNEVVEISKMKNLRVDGLFTHFARADERTPEGEGVTRDQFDRFTRFDGALCQKGLFIPFKHCCNSAASLCYPEFACDGVRLGLSLYGAGDSVSLLPSLAPVMRFETKITHVHVANAGERVGYGGDFICRKDMKIATLSVGYADGFSRDYRNASVGIVTESGVFEAKVVGRVCMDQFMADVTDIPASVGDRAIIFGDTADRIRRLAESAGTIDYECLCSVSARVPRIAH